jgi:hypothetical protein
MPDEWEQFQCDIELTCQRGIAPGMRRAIEMSVAPGGGALRRMEGP